VQEILSSALPTQPAQLVLGQSRRNVLYFSYGDHLNFMEFKRKYPDSQVVGIGFLDNWTWHVNSLGLSSISLFLRIVILTGRGRGSKYTTKSNKIRWHRHRWPCSLPNAWELHF
jgi:hypothetical protein